MEDRLKIGVIVAVAFVAGIVGTLSFTNFQTNNDFISQESDKNGIQSIGLGANVHIQAFHEDGTLFKEMTLHNILYSHSRNKVVSCMTGNDSPGFYNSCVLNLNYTALGVRNQSNPSDVDGFRTTAEIEHLPPTCDVVAGANCTGWNSTAIFDFDTLTCTPGNCWEVISIRAQDPPGNHAGYANFNDINILADPIPIGPNDRLVVEMGFTVPP